MAGPGAADCPDAPDHSASIAGLLGEVQAARTEAEAREIANRMWGFWTDAPDELAQEMLDRGMTRRSSYDFLGALKDLDRLVAYCPEYAEGYNQRAFVHFLRQDFTPALRDLDRAIALSPNHVAALSGRALTLMGLGRIDEARSALDHALELNPWLPERRLAGPGGPLAPLGKDI
ncbi:hypothetical protein CVM52_24095 [Pseudooceanicola lipolyticus]|uniref:Uncharacterized protein n=2 Tax=Pseudooceanicola lipolyticus TaxID=2029104 RepID=A0A2M8IU97_9RHOB|nr:hypothetical protein CVM52_24095 [Pseudooceanicola lipolyticus]